MVKLTVLNYWHSFRPPERLSLWVAPGDVTSIKESPFDAARGEKSSELVLKDGTTHLVEGCPDAIAASLGWETEVRDAV